MCMKLKTMLVTILEYRDAEFYHGSTDKNMNGKLGIHIGTKKAATEALESRIGVPADGEWDGSREYGKTLLMGMRRLRELEKSGMHKITGYNTNAPDDDYYPTDNPKKAKYSDGTVVPMNSKPIVFRVNIIGRMTNSPDNPHSDVTANSMIRRNLKSGNAKSGYFYKNDSEDAGSISAVVPDKSFLRSL